jgi:hypothetical protein
MRWIPALQEYRFTLVHKQGTANPADVPSRDASSCLADSTGARLDTHVQDWPLPKVLHFNGTLGSTQYTHDKLAQDLAISAPRCNNTSSVTLAAVGGATAATTPASVMALNPQHNLSTAQLGYEAVHCCLASNETALDELLLLPDSATAHCAVKLLIQMQQLQKWLSRSPAMEHFTYTHSTFLLSLQA